VRFPGAEGAMREERMKIDFRMEQSHRETRLGGRASWLTVRNLFGIGALCFLTAALVLAPIAYQKLSPAAGAAELQGSSACEANGDAKIALVKMDDEGRLMATVRINDRFEEQFQIDTGADDVVISHDAALRLGLQLDEKNYSETSETSGDDVHIAPIVFDSLEIGSIRLTSVPSYVLQNNSENLLGMSVLRGFKFSFQDGCFRIQK
jgi:clan AA aspartic protease (TIGR02281 family)